MNPDREEFSSIHVGISISAQLEMRLHRDNYCTIGTMAAMKRKNSQGNRFEIRFYEGYKGKETPRSVVIGGREFKIDRIIDRKRLLDEKSGKNCEVFTCEMEGERVRLVIHDSGKFEIAYL